MKSFLNKKINIATLTGALILIIILTICIASSQSKYILSKEVKVDLEVIENIKFSQVESGDVSGDNLEVVENNEITSEGEAEQTVFLASNGNIEQTETDTNTEKGNDNTEQTETNTNTTTGNNNTETSGISTNTSTVNSNTETDVTSTNTSTGSSNTETSGTNTTTGSESSETS